MLSRLTRCDGECVDTTSSESHCGACDSVCGAPRACRAGACIDPIVEVAVGPAHSCARSAGGAAWCWGSNIAGQLGDGTVIDRNTATRVVGLPPVVQLAAGGFTFRTPEGVTCARTASGEVWCWGSNDAGQLGNGATEPSATPIRVEGLPPVREIAVGYRRNCAVTTTSRLFCWGDVGAARRPPTEILPASVGGAWAASVSASAGTVCATDTRGSVYCMGTEPTLAQVSGIDGALRLSTSVGAQCAIRSDRSAWCWGTAFLTGTGRVEMTQLEPTMLDLAEVETVAGGSYGYTTCAVHGFVRAVSCWGLDITRDSVGTDPTYATRPTTVSGVEGARSVDVDGGHGCAALDDSSVQCWGANQLGQLGTGDFDRSATPRPVVGLP